MLGVSSGLGSLPRSNIMMRVAAACHYVEKYPTESLCIDLIAKLTPSLTCTRFQIWHARTQACISASIMLKLNKGSETSQAGRFKKTADHLYFRLSSN
jgi:hypothetical protein